MCHSANGADSGTIPTTIGNKKNPYIGIDFEIFLIVAGNKT